MRLRRLDLTAYGAFEHASIALRPDARVHIVVGANEAGKTTRRAAIADLLFGFSHISDFAFRHGNQQLRVGACIEARGTQHEVVRRKGTKVTLTTPDLVPFDDDIVASWLAGFDRESFLRYFSLSHEELERGAEYFVDENGSAAAALFGAAMGGPGRACAARGIEHQGRRALQGAGEEAGAQCEVFRVCESARKLPCGDKHTATMASAHGGRRTLRRRA